MPQVQLPIFPEDVKYITPELACQHKDDWITYFNGHLPVFTHAKDDLDTFRLITSQFVVNGIVKQSQITKAFGVPSITVKRYVKLYREKGPSGFYERPQYRGAAVLTVDVLKQAQELFDTGLEVSEVARELSIKSDTLRKAVSAGKVHKKKQ